MVNLFFNLLQFILKILKPSQLNFKTLTLPLSSHMPHSTVQCPFSTLSPSHNPSIFQKKTEKNSLKIPNKLIFIKQTLQKSPNKSIFPNWSPGSISTNLYDKTQQIFIIFFLDLLLYQRTFRKRHTQMEEIFKFFF